MAHLHPQGSWLKRKMWGGVCDEVGGCGEEIFGFIFGVLGVKIGEKIDAFEIKDREY